MYKLFIISVSLLPLTCLLSCKKEEKELTPNSIIFIANAAIDLTKAVVVDGANSNVVAFGNYRQFIVSRTRVAFNITDSNSVIILPSGKELTNPAYSIFITDQMPSPKTLIMEEANLPFIANDKTYTAVDSVVNVRFINLSPNSVPLKIKLSTATTNEIDNLPYKEISTWRPFKATATTTNYTIQLRNAATDALITSYTFTANAANRFKNVTLMIRGLQGTTTGTNAFGVTPINYF